MSKEMRATVKDAALGTTYDGEVIALDGWGRIWLWVHRTESTVAVKAAGKGVVCSFRLRKAGK